MGTVAKIEESQTAVASYERGLLDVIARAASDPTVDMDKMERLLAMQERVQERNAEIAFSEAFAAMQPELPTIKKNGVIAHNGKAISDFAEWSDINKAISPILAKHGFSLSFKPSMDDGKPGVTAILRHASGHKDEATLPLPLDASGAKNAVQAVGSSLTYGKRYAAVLILNITVEGDDDDGSAAAPKSVVQAPRDKPFPIGPARNKTDCKDMARRLGLELQEIGDGDQLVPWLALNDQAFKQIEEADDQGFLKDWWHGNRDYRGLGMLISDAKRKFGV